MREKILPARIAPRTTPTAATGATGAPTAVGLGAGFVHIQCTTVDAGAVQSGDGAIGFVAVRHFNKGKTARTASVTIRDDADAFHSAVFFKPGADGRFRRPEIEIANKDVFQVVFFPIR